MTDQQDNTVVYKRNWHIDKRVSVGHIVTTLVVAFCVVAWSLQIQAKIEVQEIRIAQSERAISELRILMYSQYAEIIRRLEYIDAKSDQHLQQHADKNP